MKKKGREREKEKGGRKRVVRKKVRGRERKKKETER